MIPLFDRGTGNLPPGVHDATWNEVKARFGDTSRRKQLLRGLERVLRQLATAGCTSVLLDGSFVTAKAEPNDYDGAWETRGVNPDPLDQVLLDFFIRFGAAGYVARYSVFGDTVRVLAIRHMREAGYADETPTPPPRAPSSRRRPS